MTNMIFDIGMHRGLDSQFYLQKGFRVVGVEADASLCAHASDRLSSYVRRGDLTVVNKAIAPPELREARFFVNPQKDDWGSLYRNVAEKGMYNAIEITVQTTTLSQLFEEFGVPYYLKSDIEGADMLVLKQLRDSGERPRFISIEADSLEFLDILEACGYERVQLVNQWCHFAIACPHPAREGCYIDVPLNNEMSGLFGRELNPDKWLTFDEARKRYGAWKYAHDSDDMLAPGWLDFHATTLRALA
jgi:FkbM family methyltransferase